MIEPGYAAGFVSFGTRVMFRSNDEPLLREVIQIADSALLGKLEPIGGDHFPLVIDVTKSRRGVRLERNGSYISQGAKKHFGKFLNAVIRVSVAEFSPKLVFLHAGAVGWKGKGIIMPADSFTGKSTLVTELVKLGAEYYSDDFAILDDRGWLHPFPRQISMRTREKAYSIYEVDPQNDLGASTGTRPIPPGMILLTGYKRGARFSPVRVSGGDGLLRTIPFALGMSENAPQCLRVLKTVADQAVYLVSLRGDAAATAAKLLTFFDRNSF